MDQHEISNRIRLTRDQMVKYSKASGVIDSIFSDIIRSASNKMITKYTKEQIKHFLECPSECEKQLRDVVDYLVQICPQFDRLYNYLPSLALLVPIVTPNSMKYVNKKEKKKKDFLNACEMIDKLNVEVLGKQILKEVFRYGVYYGLLIEGKYSYFLKKLPIDRCKITKYGEQGFVFAFDFSYFPNETYLNLGFPDDFKQLYDNYKKGIATIPGLGANWQELDITKSMYPICIKYDPCVPYSVPPLISVAEDIFDLQDYKTLNKTKAVKDNYSILGLKIPMGKNGEQDEFLVSDDMVDLATEQLEMSLPEWMGYFISPGLDMEMMRATSNDTSTTDVIQNATKNVFNTLGFADALFGVNNDTASSLAYSTQVDEQILFPLYDQLQTMFDYKIKQTFKDRMKFKLLDVSWFSLKDRLEMYKNQASLGVPVLTILPLLLGFTQLEVYSMNENNVDIWDVINTWNPPKSSYNTSDNDVGNQSKDVKDLSDNGEKNLDNPGTAKTS